MNASGNRFLTAFLAFSVIFFAVALLLRRDEAEVPDVDARPSAASTDASEMGVESTDSDVNARDEARVATVSASISSAESSVPFALGYYDFEEPARSTELPKRMREISGLAMLAGNRLLAHDDEKGEVVEIDYRNDSILKVFALGDRRGRVTDDFEGIAAAEGLLYLVTSTGRLYEFGEGADGETVPYRRYETGVGRFYEIEGLAYNPDQRSMLLISKNPRRPEQEGLIAIYRWSIDTRRLAEDSPILIETSALASRISRKEFQPSGIELHPESGNYFVVAARQHAVAEISPQGTVLAVRELKAGRHRQAEGIAFASDHTLVIADEGAGKRATLSFYPFVKGP